MMPGEEPLNSSGHFEYHNRPRHDIFWGILYACALGLTVFGGLYSSVHRYNICVKPVARIYVCATYSVVLIL